MAERSISQLIKDIGSDTQALANESKALAKAEVTEGAKKLGIGAGLAIGGLVFLYFGAFAALFAVVAALHEGAGWPWWLSFLVVFAALAIVAVVLVVSAVPILKSANPTPKTAIAEAKGAVASFRRALKNPGGPRR